MPFNGGKVELIIKPKASRLIDANDFNVGILPQNVSKVQFKNTGDNVTAIAFLNKISLSKTVTINLPIYGVSTLKKDSFKVVQTENILVKVFSNDNSSYPKSIINNETT